MAVTSLMVDTKLVRHLLAREAAAARWRAANP
jgi:hypothetical protein